MAPPQIRISDALRAKAHSPTAKVVELCRYATVLDNGELPQYEALLYQLDSSFILPVQRLYPHKNALQTYEKSASVQICVPEPARII